MIISQKSIVMLAGVVFASGLAACSTTADSPSTQLEKQAEAKTKNVDPGISTGSRLPAKPTDRLVTGTDGQEMERYRPPNPLTK
ncbi:MAG: hypothetical protein WCL29_06720 [Pseudomonadota bacterium]